MELISQYLRGSINYQVFHVITLWKQDQVKATPEIARFIEEECGITRHDFSSKCYGIIASQPGTHSNKVLGEAILSFIIYCIDHQDFATLETIFDQELIK